jgi:hypothetical protein
MKYCPLIVLFFLLVNSSLKGQDSVVCAQGCRAAEGVYLSWSDFRSQKAISKEHIESKVDKTHLDFYGKTLASGELSYKSGGADFKTGTKNIWGFYQNGALYVNHGGEFFRVPVFGAISFLIASVEVTNPAFFTPGYGMGSGPVQTKELRNFLMNYHDGIMQPYSDALAEAMISRDKELYKEFKALKSRQQKDQISRYIRKYNENNPIYFLK